MAKIYNNISKLKGILLDKIVRRLTLNSEYDPDEELIEDFLEEAITEIKKWKHNSSDNIFLDGEFDSNIIKFVIMSYHTTGIEGQMEHSANGSSSTYQMTPLQYLHSSIPQGVR